MQLWPTIVLRKLHLGPSTLHRFWLASKMASSSVPAPRGGLQALDRKTMEAERLARLARKRPAAEEPNLLSRKIAKIETASKPSLAVSPAAATHFPSVNLSKTSPVTTASTQSEMTSPSLQYPNGVVRRTWAFGHERDRDVKIEEVFQKATLKIAVLSSYMWDLPWVCSKLDLHKTKLALIIHAADENTRASHRQSANTWPQSLRVIFPPLSGGHMHSKLMLLFHPDHLRIVIPSANLEDHDWGENGIMENTMFMIDLPRLSGQAITNGPNSTLTSSFAQPLIEFLCAMQVDHDIRDGVLKFDFTKTAQYAFVHTISGTTLGPVASRTGVNGLCQAVRAVNASLSPDEPIEIDYVTSSLGSLKESQILNMIRACRGNMVENEQLGGDRDKLRICFPTFETVQNSKGGLPGAGTICLKKDWYESSTFPRDRMHNHISRRKGLLSHNKMIFARSPRIAFAYVGSANLSESAWGRPSIDRKTKQSKIYCRNWECGVLVPAKLPESEDENETASENSETESENDGRLGTPSTVVGMDVFKDIVDVPFEWPAKKYGDAPAWFFEEQ